MSFELHVERSDSPFPGVVRRWGVAARKGETVPFYLTVGPVSVHLSTGEGRLGRKLIAQFSRVLGSRPTLKYRDRAPGGYGDLTAEWLPGADGQFIVERLLLHLRLGFGAEEVR